MLIQNKWFKKICDSYLNPPVSHDGKELPGFPSDTIQSNTTGQAGINTLKEAFIFYQDCIETFKQLGVPLMTQNKLLDFGVGWGRIARFFLRELKLDNLYGIDVMEEFIKICKETFRSKNFSVCNPFPPVQFPAETFDCIVAYSVFSHLSERATLAWVKEFARILKRGGVVVLTTRHRSFLDYCEQLRETAKDGYMLGLATMFDSFDEARQRYDRGEFVHSNTAAVSGGGVRHSGYYGESFIPEGYVRQHFSQWFRVLRFRFALQGIDQAVVEMKRLQPA